MKSKGYYIKKFYAKILKMINNLLYLQDYYFIQLNNRVYNNLDILKIKIIEKK